METARHEVFVRIQELARLWDSSHSLESTPHSGSVSARATSVGTYKRKCNECHFVTRRRKNIHIGGWCICQSIIQFVSVMYDYSVGTLSFDNIAKSGYIKHCKNITCFGFGDMFYFYLYSDYRQLWFKKEKMSRNSAALNRLWATLHLEKWVWVSIYEIGTNVTG